MINTDNCCNTVCCVLAISVQCKLTGLMPVLAVLSSGAHFCMTFFVSPTISHTRPTQLLYSANSQSDQGTILIHNYYTFRTTQWSDTYRQHHVCYLCQVLNNLIKKCLMSSVSAGYRLQDSSMFLMLNAYSFASQQYHGA